MVFFGKDREVVPVDRVIYGTEIWGIFVDDVRAIPIIDEFFGFMGIISPWSSDGSCNKREKGLFVYDKALFYWYRPPIELKN